MLALRQGRFTMNIPKEISDSRRRKTQDPKPNTIKSVVWAKDKTRCGAHALMNTVKCSTAQHSLRRDFYSIFATVIDNVR